MNKTRITLISLVLGCAGAFTAAWGAESVMNLISQGEAVQSEVDKSKAALDAAVQKNHDMAAEGKRLQAEQEQLQQDMAAWQKENDTVKQHTVDYNTNCGAKDKKLTDDQFKACKADHDQLSADITRVNGEIPALNGRVGDVKAQVDKYNASVEASRNIKEDINSLNDAYESALKKEAAWLDTARAEMVTPAFQAYGKKAGCPDVQKPTKTNEAMMKMSSDVVACLKRVSNSAN